MTYVKRQEDKNKKSTGVGKANLYLQMDKLVT